MKLKEHVLKNGSRIPYLSDAWHVFGKQGELNSLALSGEAVDLVELRTFCKACRDTGYNGNIKKLKEIIGDEDSFFKSYSKLCVLTF